MDKDVVVHADIALLLLSTAEIERLKISSAVIILARTCLPRAAWNCASVLPAVANRAYNTDPPPASITAHASFPCW